MKCLTKAALAAAQAESFGVRAEVDWREGYTVLVNAPGPTAQAVAVAREVVGAARVNAAAPALTASEDFAFMLNARPGAFVRLGSAYEGRESAMLHSPHFDFNDAALPIGASFWGRLVETVLAK